MLPKTRNTPAMPAEPQPHNSTVLCAPLLLPTLPFTMFTFALGSTTVEPLLHALHCWATARALCTPVSNFTLTSLRKILNFASKDLLKELLLLCKADALATSPIPEECLSPRHFQILHKHEHIPLRWSIAASGQTLGSVTTFIRFQPMLEFRCCQAAERRWNPP